MTQTDLLIFVASWEERCALGLMDDLRTYVPKHVELYYIDSYSDRTGPTREQAERLCKEHGATISSHELPSDSPAGCWTILSDILSEFSGQNISVVVDLTTMPRDIIWMLLWFLEDLNAQISYVYHRPANYSKEWLTRDPRKPRLVYKLSGLAQLGARTALLVLAGYDVERTAHLMRHFEPSITLLGLQVLGDDADNDCRMREHRERFESDDAVRIFELDAYSADHGESVLQSQLGNLPESHNVIMSSLGPKPTAISLYRIQRIDPRIALAYAPSREFNIEYSSGIGDAIRGTVENASG